MCISSERYHFDRLWKELERPNVSFEGRTKHPMIRSVDNNTAAYPRRERQTVCCSYKESERKELIWFGRSLLTRAIIAKTHTQRRLATIRRENEQMIIE